MTETLLMFRSLAATALAMFAATAWAAHPIPPTRPVALLTPVSFAERATSKDWVKSDCDLEKAVENDVVDVLRHDGMAGESTTTSSTANGYVLEVVIERANAQPGGGWSGPKMLSLNVRLFGDGVQRRSIDVNVEAKSWNMFAGSCASLKKASVTAALHVSEWLRNQELAKHDRADMPAPIGSGASASASASVQ